jgi:hypothetical protein
MLLSEGWCEQASVRRANNRRSLPDDGVGKADAITRRAILDFLMHRGILFQPKE